MSASSASSTPVKRACDSCHRRKVKCIGEGTNPCKNCVTASLACTYNAIPQKKGPKGSRAKVLTELRESQRQSQFPGFSAELGFDGRGMPPSYTRTPGLLPPALVESCIEYYLTTVYPTQPVFSRRSLQENFLSMEHSTEAYCLMAALCAFVMIQANMAVAPNLLPRADMARMSNVAVGQYLLQESVRVRNSYDHIESPSHLSVLTSYLYYGCFCCLNKDKSAWTYLREATSQAVLLGMHDEDTYKDDPLDESRRRMLYWLLLVAERTQALQKHRPISLFATIRAPSLEQPPSERQTFMAINEIINLYKPFDDRLFAFWNKVRSGCDTRWLTQIQNQLSQQLTYLLDCTESQEVDLRVTQAWLQTTVWQLCVAVGALSSVAPTPSMTYQYPIDISRDLISTIQRFSLQAMEIHGFGLVEKLFDIAYCLIDVMVCTQLSPSAFDEGPRSYLSRLLTLISSLRGGQTLCHNLLSRVSEVLPNLALPHSVNLPQNMPLSNTAMSTELPISPHGDLGPNTPGHTPAHPSSELIRQLAAQTGAQLPIAAYTPQQAQPVTFATPSSRVEDMSLYESSVGHTAHSTGSATPSSSATPNPYETTPSQSHPPLPHSHSLGHVPSHQVQQPHPSQQAHTGHRAMQHPNLPVHPGPYDPRFGVQAYHHVQPAPMGYDDENTQHSSQGQSGLYQQQPAPSGGSAYGGESSKREW